MAVRCRAMVHGRAHQALAPCYQKPGAPMSPSPTAQSPLVLIATLDAATRIALARLVNRHGLTALASFDGAAALDACRTLRHVLQGVILDPELPTMGGSEVRAALLAERPELAIWLLGPGLVSRQLAGIDAWLAPLAAPWADEREEAPALVLA